MRGELLVGAALFTACTHARPLSSIHEVAGNTVIVETAQGEVEATAIATDTGLVLRTPGGDMPLDQATRVTERHHGRGALEGLGIGALSGGAGGVLLGIVDGDDTCDGDHCFFTLTWEAKALVGGIVFGALGGLVGLVVGSARGSRDVYEVGTPQPRFLPTGPPGSIGGVTYRF